MENRTQNEAALPSHAVLGWLPIAEAPKDTVVLVNDTTGTAPWAAARWCETEEWNGWVYDDEAVADAMPLGPCPTHYLIPPPVPNAVITHAAESSENQSWRGSAFGE